MCKYPAARAPHGVPLSQTQFLPGDHARSRQPVAGSGFALSHAKLLQDVSRERLELLSRECGWYRYDKGAEIIAQQITCREVYFIASGAVRVRIYSAAGRQVSFRDVEAGLIVEDIAAVDGGRRSTDVTALVESVLAALPAAAFMLLLREQPVVRERYLGYLTGLIRQLTARVTELSTLAVPHRRAPAAGAPFGRTGKRCFDRPGADPRGNRRPGELNPRTGYGRDLCPGEAGTASEEGELAGSHRSVRAGVSSVRILINPSWVKAML